MSPCTNLFETVDGTSYGVGRLCTASSYRAKRVLQQWRRGGLKWPNTAQKEQRYARGNKGPRESQCLTNPSPTLDSRQACSPPIIQRWGCSSAAAAAGCASDPISEAEKGPRHPAISEKRRSEQSRVGEKGRADARARFELEESRPGGDKGVRRAGGPIKRMEVPVSSLIRLLTLHLHLHSLYLAAHFPAHPLYYTVALDSGSEARYVRRQGRGLGI